MKNVLVMPLAYFGPIGHYAVQLSDDTRFFDCHEHYIKQSWRNRCDIHGANGAMKLVIPVQHEGRHVAMKDVKIHNTESWQTVHWKSLESAYRSSPFFEHYENELKNFYTTRYAKLFDFLSAGEKWVWNCLGFKPETRMSERYQTVPAERDFRLILQPKSFTPPANLFPVYYQVFGDRNGFIRNLSILDLLFSKGPKSMAYLEAISQPLKEYLKLHHHTL